MHVYIYARLRIRIMGFKRTVCERVFCAFDQHHMCVYIRSTKPLVAVCCNSVGVPVHWAWDGESQSLQNYKRKDGWQSKSRIIMVSQSRQWQRHDGGHK